MSPVISIILIILALLCGVIIGFIYRKTITERKLEQTDAYIKDKMTQAENTLSKAEERQKEIVLGAREKAMEIQAQLDREITERRNEVSTEEARIKLREEEVVKKEKTALERNEEISRRETALDRREDGITGREKGLDKREDKLEARSAEQDKREKGLDDREAQLDKQEEKLNTVYAEQLKELEHIANMTVEEAKGVLIERVRNDAYRDAAVIIREIENKAKQEGEAKARNIITMAIQRCASDQVYETTSTTVSLPNEEMKGRLIGQKGRNIQTIERITGVDLIIDDTPGAVTLSTFSLERREKARLLLEKLIQDGRIQTTRIEDDYSKISDMVDKEIRETGEKAALDVGHPNINVELLNALGKLRYRTSYGQNVLAHSLEVAYIAGVLAAEVGANVSLAKRAGLLHDIGKSCDREQEGTHVSVGVEMARRCGESEEVIHCIEAHHNDVEAKTIEAVLIQAADAISAARPGARRDTIEKYIQRIRNLESIGKSFAGVSDCYAIQAGRELRIIVTPEDVDDEGTLVLAKQVAERIQSEMQYPGQIKVNVIRETRSVEFAK